MHYSFFILTQFACDNDMILFIAAFSFSYQMFNSSNKTLLSKPLWCLWSTWKKWVGDFFLRFKFIKIPSNSYYIKIANALFLLLTYAFRWIIYKILWSQNSFWMLFVGTHFVWVFTKEPSKLWCTEKLSTRA